MSLTCDVNYFPTCVLILLIFFHLTWTNKEKQEAGEEETNHSVVTKAISLHAAFSSTGTLVPLDQPIHGSA